ncbi:hypothetical protein DRO69_02685 [Candidatus Bathyarchaeota archaeon]|nr:MAG: hypothetical protein DRO69_02685 [Candidatus Bathyarchaeota archaeon]
MEITTASGVISYIGKVEENSAKLYENLAQKYPEDGETFLSLAKENRRNKKSIEYAYYGVISDKLEACFCFENLDTDNYSIKTELPEEINYPDALKKLIDLEEKIQRFLLDAAKQLKSLVPDVSFIFERVGKKRAKRVTTLKSLLDKAAK